MTTDSERLAKAKRRLSNIQRNIDFEKSYGNERTLGIQIMKQQELIEKINKVESSIQNKSIKRIKNE